MKKFIEAKEAKGYSYRDIADGIGTGYTAQAICNVFHGKLAISMDTLTKIGKFLDLSKNDIKEAYLENRIIFTENLLNGYKAELEKLKPTGKVDKGTEPKSKSKPETKQTDKPTKKVGKVKTGK
jgi:transcriptional regulator with XRE-family HTH domain